MDEVLSCKQEKSVRFRTRAPRNSCKKKTVRRALWERSVLEKNRGTSPKVPPNLFREIQARCRDLTVNQWLGEFDSHTRSQIYPVRLSVRSTAFQVVETGSIPVQDASFVREWCRGNTTDFDSVVLGSIPSSRATNCWGLV